MAPPTRMTVSEWADSFRYLPPETSAEPGRWRTDNAPYQREMMDCLSDRKTREIWIQAASQVGKTEVLLNMIAFHIHKEPCSMLFVLPTLELAEEMSKNRLANTIRDTPVLRELVKDRSRTSESTILRKTYPGGSLNLCGANSPSSLASRPIPVIFCDEVTKFTASSGGEGDPIRLAMKRSATFHNRKFIAVSSPGLRGRCRMEKGFLASDQRHFYVPCPFCKHMQILTWHRVKWPEGKPNEAYYECEACTKRIAEGYKPEMLCRGEWRAHAPFRGIAGFHIPSIYSPKVSFADLAETYERAKSDSEQLQTFVNTELAETWEESTEGADSAPLYLRRETYSAEVPGRVLVLTAGVDVQQDRLEVEVVGWCFGLESYSIDYLVIHGDPKTDDPWDELDQLLEREFTHEYGVRMRIRGVAVDSGGHHTGQVYDYCRRRSARKVFACKGVGGEGRVFVGSISRQKSGRQRRHVDLYPIGVDEAKATHYSRLKVEDPGPGYCHFPKYPRYNEDYFKQLTSEYIVIKHRHGHPVRTWEKRSSVRNEALDCRIYAMAAFGIVNPSLPDLERRMEAVRVTYELRLQGKDDGISEEAVTLETPRRRVRHVANAGWLHAWKARY